MPASPAIPQANAASGRLTPWLLAAFAVESLGLALLLKLGREALWLIVPLHLLVTGALAWNVGRVRRSGHDTTLAMLGCLTVAALGPAGAIGVVILAMLDRDAGDRRLLAAWYERIALSVAVDPVTRFCDDVGSGRMIDLGAPTPPSYAAVMASGSLVERQAALGNIARRFHPDYLPVLAQALNSPEPVIRVQAAAVAAQIRPEVARTYRTAVESIPEQTFSAAGALTLLGTFETLIASGLLDEGDRRHGTDIIERLGDIVLALMARGEAVLPRRSPVEVALPLEATFERLLIRRRRFAELRQHRSARAVLAARPRANIRRLVLPSHAAGAAE